MEHLKKWSVKKHIQWSSVYDVFDLRCCFVKSPSPIHLSRKCCAIIHIYGVKTCQLFFVWSTWCSRPIRWNVALYADDGFVYIHWLKAIHWNVQHSLFFLYVLFVLGNDYPLLWVNQTLLMFLCFRLRCFHCVNVGAWCYMVQYASSDLCKSSFTVQTAFQSKSTTSCSLNSLSSGWHNIYWSTNALPNYSKCDRDYVRLAPPSVCSRHTSHYKNCDLSHIMAGVTLYKVCIANKH